MVSEQEEQNLNDEQPVEETAEPTEVSAETETPEAVTEESPAEEVAEETPAPEAEPAEEAPKKALRPEDEPMFTPGMNWFVLRVASNKENYVKETLLRKIKIEGFTHLVNRILVPTEKVRSIKGGKTRVMQKKLYPGYVFVEMKLEDDGRIPQDIFFLIKETTGVGDFIGTAGRPAPMQPHEVEKMIEASRQPEDEPEVKMEFKPGDPVKIKEGAFENMDGTVDTLMPEQGKVRVVVEIFGRSTPVEMEYWLIEKAEEA